MTIFYKMLMFTEALYVSVNPLIYLIKNTFFRKRTFKKQSQRDNQRNSEKSCVTKVGQTL